MASRRMRIKAVANVPSLGKSRPTDRPTTPLCGYTEPSSPAPYSGPDVSRASPKTPGHPMSPLSYPPSPTQKVLSTSDDRVFPISSPGMMSPRSPHSYRSSYASAPTSPLPATSTAGGITNPESPRRPATPLTPSSLHGENSQDKIMSPVYSPSYSAFSPGVGPGISVAISRAPTPKSPALALSPAVMSEDSNSSVASSSRSTVSRGPSKAKAQKRPPPFSQTNSSSQSNSALKEALSPGTSVISAVLNNSDTLRQRLQKGAIVPSTSKYALIRKDYLAKYQNKLPDPKDLTMLHYAFFNPPKADAPGEEEGKGETGQVAPKPPAPAKRRRRTESRDSVASSVSVVSSTPPAAPETIAETEEETNSQPVGPRVKVGPDGQLIIDEKSLVIETTQAQRAKKQLAEMETVSGSSLMGGSSGFRRKPLKRGVDWDEKETMKFYKALITCGTDFSMMATVFKGTRTRGELKAKFKREDRRNPQQVSRALAKQCFDPTLALTDSEDEESVIGDNEESSKDNDIENVKAPKKRKDDFKKTLQTMKKKGELVGPMVPPLRSMSFRRPAGKLDWDMYDVLKKNLLESKSDGQEERDVYAIESLSTTTQNSSTTGNTQRASDSSPKKTSSDVGKSGSDAAVPKKFEKVLGFDSEDPLGFNIVRSSGPCTSNLSMPSLDAEPTRSDTSGSADLKTLNIVSSELELPCFTLVSVDAQQDEEPDESSTAEEHHSIIERTESTDQKSEVLIPHSTRIKTEVTPTSSESSSIGRGASADQVVESNNQNSGESEGTRQSPRRNTRRRLRTPHVRIPGPGAYPPRRNSEKKSGVEEIEIEITCK